jgi:hypothetical protein
MAVADTWRAGAGLPCDCLQVDEANIPGNPEDGAIAAEAINRVLTGVRRPPRRASLLRQLRRPVDPAGNLARSHRDFLNACRWITSSSKWRIGRKTI